MNRAVMPITDYENTCDKIREKTETTDLIKSGELPEKIEAVYENGKADKEREMWGYILNYGTKADLNKAFCDTGFEYIRPPYKVTPTNIQSLSQTFSYAKKLKKVEAAYFDFSKKKRGSHHSHGLYWTFSTCSSLEEVEDIGIQPDIGLYNTFSWSGIKRIAMLRVDEQTQYENVFQGCGKLEDITLEGVIGQNGLSFGNSPLLTHESLLNIIDCLKDFRETVIEHRGVNVSMPHILTTNTLVEGVKYYLTYEGDNFEPYTAEATAGQVTVMPSGISALGLEFEMPSQTSGDIPLIWVYQDGGNLMYDAYFGGISNAKITLSKAPTETRSITFGTTNLSKLTDAEKVVATQKGWTLL